MVGMIQEYVSRRGNVSFAELGRLLGDAGKGDVALTLGGEVVWVETADGAVTVPF